MLRLCAAGAAGRMGNTVIREAVAKNHQITGAVEAPGNSCIGKTLRELGICDSDTRIVGSRSPRRQPRCKIFPLLPHWASA